MPATHVPVALRERLGQEATTGLVDLLDSSSGAWRDQVLSLAVERFERRLAQELSALRVEIAQGQATLKVALHEDLAAGLGDVRQEVAALRGEMASFRGEMRGEMAALRGGMTSFRGEMRGEMAALRGEMASFRGEMRGEAAGIEARLLKWSFLFWIGQLATTAGLLALMLRGVAR